MQRKLSVRGCDSKATLSTTSTPAATGLHECTQLLQLGGLGGEWRRLCHLPQVVHGACGIKTHMCMSTYGVSPFCPTHLRLRGSAVVHQSQSPPAAACCQQLFAGQVHPAAPCPQPVCLGCMHLPAVLLPLLAAAVGLC
jgi:hypothetical protein